MKILVSASACNPYRGSEPGVGWAAVCRIARDHDVFVLTDVNHRHDWEKARTEGMVPDNVQVRFLGKPKTFLENRLIARIQSWLWYMAYSKSVLKTAEKWHKAENFDLCHQVTIATWRVPSPLWKLPIPFVWGPIGGAGHVPKQFRKMLSPAARAFEKIRDIQTYFAMRLPSFRKCMHGSSMVLAANEENANFLRPFRQGLPISILPVMSLPTKKVSQLQRPASMRSKHEPLQLFAGGNIIGTKGVALAIHALKKVKEANVDFHYTVAGGGPETAHLKKLTLELGLQDQITFHPGFSGKDYIHALHETDVYFLPSFRETMGMTLVEAILAGCYPVVADISAQGEIVRLVGGKAIPVKSIKSLIDGLAEAVVWCAEHRDGLFPMANESAKRVADIFSTECYEVTLKEGYSKALES